MVGSSNGPDGTLVYEQSGLEPVLHVGSRRGVPYRTKLAYRLQAPLAPLPRFLDDDTIAALLASDTTLDFFVDVLPLVAKEIGWAYYHELFAAHPERTTTSWDEFSTEYAATDWGDLGPLLADVRARPGRPLRHRRARPAAGRRPVRIERCPALARRRDTSPRMWRAAPILDTARTLPRSRRCSESPSHSVASRRGSGRDRASKA